MDEHKLRESEIYVLIDAPEARSDVLQYGSALKFDVQKLGDALEQFTSNISQAIARCKNLAPDLQLDAVEVEAKLTAEFGLALVSKAGIEGGIRFTFKRTK
jgi:hypothetical protein